MIQPIVLAAGMGTRMKAIKALIPINDVPALEVVLRVIRAAKLQHPIVVLGHDAAAIRRSVDLAECRIVTNSRPEDGMSQSLRLGLAAIDTTATGILLFHVDMPFVKPMTVRTVVEAARPSSIRLAAPVHDGKRGFPVYAAREIIPALTDSLHGDHGGRAFLDQHRSELCFVPVRDPGCVFDIDTPSDLTAWKGETLCAISE